MRRLLRYQTLLGILIAIGLTACNNTGTFNGVEPDPPLIRITDVSGATPAVGQSVEIGWSLIQDDHPDSLRRVVNQVIRLLSFTIDGSSLAIVEGCLPEGMLDGGPPLPCIEMERRLTSFTFPGPVIFSILVFDQDGLSEERVIKFKLPGQSFRVSGDTRGFLNASASTTPTVNLPRGGTITGSFGEVEFERAFGIAEVGDEDSVIDQLAEDPVLSRIFGDSPFLLSMTPISMSSRGPVCHSFYQTEGEISLFWNLTFFSEPPRERSFRMFERMQTPLFLPEHCRLRERRSHLRAGMVQRPRL
jgi:hypothetical protein